MANMRTIRHIAATAIDHAGDVFLPSQLHAIFKSARRQKLYNVFPMEYDSFLDFKKLSQDLHILQIRETDSTTK